MLSCKISLNSEGEMTFRQGGTYGANSMVVIFYKQDAPMELSLMLIP